MFLNVSKSFEGFIRVYLCMWQTCSPTNCSDPNRTKRREKEKQEIINVCVYWENNNWFLQREVLRLYCWNWSLNWECDDFYVANVWLYALASFVFFFKLPNIFPHIHKIECVSDHTACVNWHVDDWKLATSHSIPSLEHNINNSYSSSDQSACIFWWLVSFASIRSSSAFTLTNCHFQYTTQLNVWNIHNEIVTLNLFGKSRWVSVIRWAQGWYIRMFAFTTNFPREVWISLSMENQKPFVRNFCA